MKVASITETKNQLSALLARVRQGETIVIVDRGRPVARLEPVHGRSETDEERIARLERQGVLRRASAPPDRALVARKPPKARPGASILRALLEERREGR